MVVMLGSSMCNLKNSKKKFDFSPIAKSVDEFDIVPFGKPVI